MAALCGLALLCLGLIAKLGQEPATNTQNQLPISENDLIRLQVDNHPVYQSQIDLTRTAMSRTAPEIEGRSIQLNDERIIDHLIQQKLLAQAAEKSKIANSPDILNQIQLAKEQIFAKAMVDQHLENSVTEQNIQDFYDTERKLNPPVTQIKARQIVLPDEATAKEILRRLDKGDSFASLALAFSIDRASRESGGDLGFVSRDMLEPIISEALFMSKKNGRLDPFKTSEGWHVVEVIGRRQAPIPSFENRRDDIEALLKSQSLETLLEQLKSRANISYVNVPNEEEEEK